MVNDGDVYYLLTLQPFNCAFSGGVEDPSGSLKDLPQSRSGEIAWSHSGTLDDLFDHCLAQIAADKNFNLFTFFSIKKCLGKGHLESNHAV